MGTLAKANVQGCGQREVDAYIAVGKQAHNPWLDQELAKQEPELLGKQATPSMQMSNKLKTEVGRAIYRLRKMTVESVFGIIKEIMGFRRFSFSGQAAINDEWLLVCSAFNLKRLFVLVTA